MWQSDTGEINKYGGSTLIRKSVIISLAFAAALSAAPQLQLSTTSIGPLHVLPGVSGPTQSVDAYNAGSGTLNLTTIVSAPWLSANVGALKACTTRTGNCNPIAISLSTATLAAGTYTGYVNVTDPNAIDSPQQITVTVQVAGIPSSITQYITPFGGAQPVAYTPIYTQGAVTGTATTQSGGNWLSFVVGGITNPGTIYGVQVAAQNGMVAGNYTGSIVLTGTNAADNKTISVTLNVSNSPIIGSDISPVQLNGFGGGPKPSTAVAFTNVGSGTLTITGAMASSSTGNFLSASVSGPSSITITADPGTLAAGLYTGSVSLTSNASNNSQISIPVVFNVEPAGTPLISSGGIVNIGDYAPDGAAPGEILAIFGDQLAAQGTLATNPGLPPLAITLGSVQVLVNGTPAPLYFTSSGQVNFQLPYELAAGQVAAVQVVANGKAGNLRPLNVVASVPRLLIWPSIAGNYGIVANQDYSLVLSTTIPGYTSHPAKAGDTITIYCTGLGQTSPGGVTGAAASSSPLQSVSNVTVTFGGAFSGSPTTVNAYFAGLTPTAVGLYQVNATLPPNVPTGAAVPITINVNGAVSNVAYIPISQ
jgi:uncharacterized protein (TIGR03437 family)